MQGGETQEAPTPTDEAPTSSIELPGTWETVCIFENDGDGGTLHPAFVNRVGNRTWVRPASVTEEEALQQYAIAVDEWKEEHPHLAGNAHVSWNVSYEE